jgi:hypothetical protein
MISDGSQVDIIKRKYKKDSDKTHLVQRHRQSVFHRIANKELQTPDTWEVALSGGKDKKSTFERLMNENKLGALAFLRNLRNMKESGVDDRLVMQYSVQINLERVLPFRFIAAANAVPAWESLIEGMMLRCLEGGDKLSGKTVICVDNSGSMYGTKISAKSELDRADAACALAILIRETCEFPCIIGFGTDAKVIPARRGFALRDAIKKGCGGGTDTAKALNLAASEKYDRIIVLTDEQSNTKIPKPIAGSKAYFINVANYKNGISYSKEWLHIDGWSEAVIDYIKEYEQMMYPQLNK